jgi:hypothetical protein
MNIFTAHWKYYIDDYYSPDNRKMFLYREDADKFLDDLINYNGVDKYYILEETVFDQYSPQTYYDDYYYDDYYDGPGDEDWAIDEWSNHISDMKHYDQLEIDEMYKQHYHFSWGLGKNVLHTDSMWFTSDEIEAFREIWQRRLSA